MQFQPSSQCGEDVWMVGNLQLPSNGVFVEVGAEHGGGGSNTLSFERMGWTGLLIEANPDLLPFLQRNRPNCKIESCAIGSDPTQMFYINPQTPISALGRPSQGRPVKVPVKRLGDVLDAHGIGHIDLLSIDVEGSELDAWSTLDHNKHTPSIVIIEWNTTGLPYNDKAVREVFSKLPYKEVHQTIANLIFVRTTTP